MVPVNDDDKYQSGQPLTPDLIPQGVIISPDTHRDNRIPPNQVRTRKWPVLQAGMVPIVDKDKWQLTIDGLVDRPLTLSWHDYQKLPRVKVFADLHCVTRWSRLSNIWEGVSTKTIAELVGIQSNAKFVLPGGYDDGWTTNFPLEYFLADDALIADLHDDQPLTADHGAPARLIIPQLYAWKSAKWLKSLTFAPEDHRGYWEQAGYHNLGDPWLEQRFQDNENIPPGYYD